MSAGEIFLFGKVDVLQGRGVKSSLDFVPLDAIMTADGKEGNIMRGYYYTYGILSDEVQEFLQHDCPPFVVCVADIRVPMPNRRGRWTDSWSRWFGRTLSVAFIVSRRMYHRWFEEIPGQVIRVSASRLTKNWFDLNLRIKDETGRFKREIQQLCIDKNAPREGLTSMEEGRLHLLCDLHGIDIVKIPTVGFGVKKENRDDH